MIRLCNHEGCNQFAKWQVGFVVWARNYPKSDNSKIDGTIQIFLCDDHKSTVVPSDVFYKQSTRMLDREIERIAMIQPNWKTAELVFTPIRKSSMN